MLRLRVVQAAHGDCLILESDTPPHLSHVLIDGGPETTYDKHLRGELRKIRDSGGKLDLVVLSHVDSDHVMGLRDMMAELEEQRADGADETVAVDCLWHNAFRRTVGVGTDIEPRLKALLVNVGAARNIMTTADMALQGISQGEQIRRAAAVLGIPINPNLPNDLISVDEIPEPVMLGALALRIVGPTKKNLEELRKKWLEWLDKYEESITMAEEPSLAAMADRSIPNLSSIMLLAESDGRRVLLTGDGRGDHLLQGLDQADLLDAEGKLHVDVLKLPHHGSDRNATKAFFEAVTADKYVVSADGKYGNPDLATLVWIAEAAREQGHSIAIYVTNSTPSTRQLTRDCDPDEYGYRLIEMEDSAHSMIV